MQQFIGSDRSSGIDSVRLSICLSGISLSRAFNLHVSGSYLQADFKINSDDFRKTSGRLWEVFRMTQSTQRAIREQESNQTSSYCWSLKYFVLLLDNYLLRWCIPLWEARKSSQIFWQQAMPSFWRPQLYSLFKYLTKEGTIKM